MPIENETGTPGTERRRTNMIVTRFGMMMCMMDMGMMTMPKPLCASAKNLLLCVTVMLFEGRESGDAFRPLYFRSNERRIL